MLSDSELDSLNNLSRNVNLNNIISNYSYKLISQKQINSIITNNNIEDRLRIMDSLCPKGFITLTKPFFNKTLDTVFIEINEMPYSCLSGYLASYYYINNDWIIHD